MDSEAASLIQRAREAQLLMEQTFELPSEEPEPPKEVLKFKFGPQNFWPEKEESTKVKAIGFVEQFFNEYGKLPAEADFLELFDKEELPPTPEAWQDFLVELQAPLVARGIRPYETPLHLLEPRFVLAVNLMCDVLDRRAAPAKFKEAGITTKQWKAFLANPKYLKYYENAVNQIYDKNARVAARINLAKLVEAGDLAAIKHFEEKENIYRPQKDSLSHDMILRMLTAMMEILAKHVSADVLKIVAQEFQERDIITVPALPVGN